MIRVFVAAVSTFDRITVVCRGNVDVAGLKTAPAEDHVIQ